jgi:uncharacterized protein (DUF1330 family)
LASASGGTCTGEHGVGEGKAGGLARQSGPAITVMLSLKRALDAEAILNPGKLFTRPRAGSEISRTLRPVPDSRPRKEQPMTKAYWIARVDIHDPDAYKNYVTGNAAAFSKYRATFLVRAGKSEVLEGTGRSRNVVVEFPDYDTAVACYHSPEYQEAMKHRMNGVAEADLVVVEGWEGGAPPMP